MSSNEEEEEENNTTTTTDNTTTINVNQSVKCFKCNVELECSKIDRKSSPGKLIIISPIPVLPVLIFNICSNCCALILSLLKESPINHDKDTTALKYLGTGIS